MALRGEIDSDTREDIAKAIAAGNIRHDAVEYALRRAHALPMVGQMEKGHAGAQSAVLAGSKKGRGVGCGAERGRHSVGNCEVLAGGGLVTRAQSPRGLGDARRGQTGCPPALAPHGPGRGGPTTGLPLYWRQFRGKTHAVADSVTGALAQKNASPPPCDAGKPGLIDRQPAAVRAAPRAVGLRRRNGMTAGLRLSLDDSLGARGPGC
jgi:hypothetical protein